MKDTLRDQLLKAGLVDEKQARQAEREKKEKARQARKARKSGKKPRPGDKETAARRAREERERQARRSRELNRAREADRARSELGAQVRDLLKTEARPRGKGEIRYHFTDGTRIKRIYVDRAQQEALARGDLAIVRWEDAYHVVPTEVAGKIRDRSPGTPIFVAEPEESDPDDPYADFPIPDDLEW